jgi:hypothetical protein
MSGKQVQIRVLYLQTRNCQDDWLLVCNYRGKNFQYHKNLHVKVLCSAGMTRVLDPFGLKTSILDSSMHITTHNINSGTTLNLIQ